MKPQRTSGSRRFTFLTLVLVLVPVGLLFTVGGFAFAATQESRDSFCGSCHSQPESTYVERITAGQPVDLATYHTGQQTRCIDCHSGQGISGRISAEMMGARNAFKWVSGTAQQPAPLLIPISDDHCLKCHADISSRDYQNKTNMTLPGEFRQEEGGEEGGSGHWHVFLPRWQEIDKSAASCVDCHRAHHTGGAASSGFLDPQTTAQVCDDCHRKAGD